MAENLILEVVEIDKDGMHIKMDLIEEDIKILLLFGMVRSKIWSLQTIIVYLVCYLITFVFGIKCVFNMIYIPIFEVIIIFYQNKFY